MNGATLDLNAFRRGAKELILPESQQPGPPGHPFCPDRVMWKLRNYVGGSWTGYLQAGRKWEGKEDDEEENDEPRRRTLIDELCPLGLAGRGDLRHVCLQCQEAGLPEMRAALWDAVEERSIPSQRQRLVDALRRVGILAKEGHPRHRMYAGIEHAILWHVRRECIRMVVLGDNADRHAPNQMPVAQPTRTHTHAEPQQSVWFGIARPLDADIQEELLLRLVEVARGVLQLEDCILVNRQVKHRRAWRHNTANA